MNISELVQQLDADSVIEMYELDTTGIGGTEHFYFHDGVSAVAAPIVWQGVTYAPWPVEADGFEMSARGVLPRPRVKIANINGSISAVTIAFDDLVGAKLIRRRTFARYLDGQPGADPSQHFDNDTFYVERKVTENQVVVEFELSSALDLEGQQLPNRPIIAGSCWWQYRSTECSYAGTNYFNSNNVAVGSLPLDVCSKSQAGCKLRFGARAVLPFGGFPAAKTYKL